MDKLYKDWRRFIVEQKDYKINPSELSHAQVNQLQTKGMEIRGEDPDLRPLQGRRSLAGDWNLKDSNDSDINIGDFVILPNTKYPVKVFIINGKPSYYNIRQKSYRMYNEWETLNSVLYSGPIPEEQKNKAWLEISNCVGFTKKGTPLFGTDMRKREVSPNNYLTKNAFDTLNNSKTQLSIKSYIQSVYEKCGGVDEVEKISKQYGGNPNTQGIATIIYSASKFPSAIGSIKNLLRNISFPPRPYEGGNELPQAHAEPELDRVVLGRDSATNDVKHHEIQHLINKNREYNGNNQYALRQPIGVRDIDYYHDRNQLELQAEELAIIKHYWASQGQLAKNKEQANKQLINFFKIFDCKDHWIFDLLKSDQNTRDKLLRLYLQTVYNTPKEINSMIA